MQMKFNEWWKKPRKEVLQLIADDLRHQAEWLENMIDSYPEEALREFYRPGRVSCIRRRMALVKHHLGLVEFFNPLSGPLT